MKITVVTPTYNEAENLPKLVSALFSLSLPDLSLLIVDDNSPDGTGQLADEFKRSNPGRFDVLHRAGKMGLGSAYIMGFQYLLGQGVDVIVQMDADFSHPPEKIVEMVEMLPVCDVVIGSRYVPGGSVDVRWPFWRKMLSSWGNLYARTILRLPMHDVTGGFRMWKSAVLKAMPLDQIRSNGYIFQVETGFVANRLGFHFKEIPIYFADRRFGASKMSLGIQLEAAVRVWQLRAMYKNFKKPQPTGPILPD